MLGTKLFIGKQFVGKLLFGREQTSVLTPYLLLLICFFAIPLKAESVDSTLYWVVGSFKSYPVALGVSADVRAHTQVTPVYTVASIGGQNYFRLLIEYPLDQEERDLLREQLAAAGIAEPWPLRLTARQIARLDGQQDMQQLDDLVMAAQEPGVTVPQTKADRSYLSAADTDQDSIDDEFIGTFSSSDSMPRDYYLVLGSYNDYQTAQVLVEKILREHDRITELRAFDVDGKSIIRVLAGPYMDMEGLSRSNAEFSKAGIDDAWVLIEDSPFSGLADYDDMLDDFDYEAILSEQARRSQVAGREPRQVISQPENTIAPGYNLARLKP